MFSRVHVGAPGEDAGSINNSGVMGVWNQDTSGVSTAVEAGDQLGAALGWVQLTRQNDEADYRLVIVTVPREDLSGVTDAGLAYVGTTPGSGTVALRPPVRQTGAGIGMVPMRTLG